jgi:hypothetical protein
MRATGRPARLAPSSDCFLQYCTFYINTIRPRIARFTVDAVGYEIVYYKSALASHTTEPCDRHDEALKRLAHYLNGITSTSRSAKVQSSPLTLPGVHHMVEEGTPSRGGHRMRLVVDPKKGVPVSSNECTRVAHCAAQTSLPPSPLIAPGPSRRTCHHRCGCSSPPLHFHLANGFNTLFTSRPPLNYQDQRAREEMGRAIPCKHFHEERSNYPIKSMQGGIGDGC